MLGLYTLVSFLAGDWPSLGRLEHIFGHSVLGVSLFPLQVFGYCTPNLLEDISSHSIGSGG